MRKKLFGSAISAAPRFAAAALLLLLFGGCRSLQKDLLIDSPGEARELNMAELEGMIVTLDRNDEAAAVRRAKISAARQRIADMEKEAGADPDYEARLRAWSGRLSIIEGRYSEAVRQQRLSLSLSPGNIPSIILGLRLEGDPAKRLELIDREISILPSRAPQGAGELWTERGRALFELGRFGEAAGAFDNAFAAGLDPVYRETYGQTRDRAWELRNAEGFGGDIGILEHGGLSWQDCISLAKNETRLLYFLTAGRDLGEAELFDRLLDRSFIPYTQDITRNEWPRTKPGIKDPVFRSGAAWFIWRLYAEARGDRGLLTRYSARYASGGSPRSPIPDLPPLSPFFDCILGCVETELMSLPEGRNFSPAEPIRGTEMLSILRKMK
ncbi:MAG: hypothetical protein LBJ90_02105 [Treponema sp.]|jgi:tetratricopeptide (TPR) repeat protein|nr:hypothetical protein [Treponema sp.]